MTPAHRETILIVDDQEENIRVVGSVLSLMSYDIIPATSAEQALRRLQARTPDIILLDVMMPGTDGLTTCRQIRQNPAWLEIPIIFLSAADDKNVIVQALEAGGVDYVTKPFNRAELLTRVRTHLSLKQARDHLRRLAEDKDEILGILAHDLKNGIAGIQLSASLLHERTAELPPRSASLVDNIHTTSERLMEHMKHFLANQRAEQLTLAPAPLDPAAVLQKAVAMSHAAALAKNITLTLDPPAQITHVMADHEALLQVFDNLVSNAVKFTPPGGSVHAAVENPSLGFVRIHLRDSGPGFSAADRARLFRRYQRLSARPTASEPSTGLGLSIVKRLLTLMNGEIHLADAAPEHGAAFTVQLPVAPLT
ncbi:MAG: hybrid sensor histidine kinase/response regulator [Verrucomicrobiaceae bacterium]|nr:hybrid sensor histidine kinase/response regulator [Verrucomicrobiaceae bacterium]